MGQGGEEEEDGSEYLGKITPDGRFIRKIPSLSKDLGKAMAIIESYGGTVTLPEKREAEPIATLELEVSEVDEKLLTVMSMNARADMSYFGKQVGLTASATYSRVKHLEKRYGIKYLPEIDIRKLGYLTYLIFVKFTEKAPNSEILRKELEKQPAIQVAMLTQGRYDLVMYVLIQAYSLTQIYQSI